MASLWKIAPREMRLGVLVSLLVSMAAISPAAAQGVSGGDQHLTPEHTGFIPPNVFAGLGRYDPVTRCEVQVARNINDYAGCTLICVAGDRKANANPTQCRSKCLSSHFYHVFDRPLVGCPPCLDAAGQAEIAEIYRGFIEDELAPVLYCDAAVGATCADKVSGALRALIKCITRAQLERAIYELKTAETAIHVEDKCQTIYETSVSRLTGCAACLSPGVAVGLGDTVREFMDSHSDLPFCQQ